jgi:hypothetical protein
MLLLHRLSRRQPLLPEWLSPCECPVFYHPFVTAPNVVDENIDLARLPSNALERGRHLKIRLRGVRCDHRTKRQVRGQCSFSPAVEDTHYRLRGFEICDPDGYVLFFGRPE